MTAGTRFSLQCATAWATCWGIALGCFAYIRHTKTTPKGGTTNG